jgi:uncharacterized damage-inducible protein DinB
MTKTDHSEIIAGLRASLRELPALVDRLPPERLRTAPGPDEWSAAGVLAHLADAEQVYGVRLKMIATADQPALTPYDQDDWERRFGPLESATSALERWRVLRQSMLRVLESLDEAAWERTGLHQERGPESIAKIARLLVDHDRLHMKQMERAATS